MTSATDDTVAYRPSMAVLEKIRLVTLVGVVGPSGAGKTTLIDAAIAQDPQLFLVLGDTSRAPRPGEQDGLDYRFRDRHEMLRRMRLREYVQVPPNITGDLYATAPESYSSTGISLFAIWAAAIPTFRQLPFKSMRTIFVTPPNYQAWQNRLGERNALQLRKGEARQSFEFALADPEVLFVINDDLPTAVADFCHLAHGHSLTPKLQLDQQRAPAVIQTILASLA